MKRLMLLPLVLVVMLFSISAHAQCSGKKDWRWWEVGKLTQMLEISEEQQMQLNDIAAKFDPIIKEASENAKNNKTTYIETKTNKENSSADVIKAFDTMWDSTYKMKRVKLDRYLEMRAVLNQDQVTELHKMKEDHKDRMMKRQERMKEHHDHMKKEKESTN